MEGSKGGSWPTTPRRGTGPREGRSRRARAGARFALLSLALTGAALLASAVGGSSALGATVQADSAGLAPLSSVPVPKPVGLNQYVRNEAAAIALGKALFWDMQAGSDGNTACATCHFSAGVDNRSRNTLNPGAAGFTTHYPNYQLDASDFPFHRLADPSNRDSAVLYDTTAIVGSQGVHPSQFIKINRGSQVDRMTPDGPDPVFSMGGVNVRRVTGRQAPPVINAVFNYRNFFDGRAQNEFNGVNPFGDRDPNARVASFNSATGSLSLVRISIDNASPASQAVGPPGNPVEMSAAGRTLKDIAKKLLSLRPLGRQVVSPTDSVLGPMANTSGRGLTASYKAMVKAAFLPKWWKSGKILRVESNGDVTILPPHTPLAGNEYTHMQYNWSLFWGLSINLYEATLIADQTPVDRFLTGDDSALTDLEKQGLGRFESGKANCTECHAGAEMTTASVSSINATGLTDTLPDGDRIFDTGFVNIGVRLTAEDVGNGGFDPFGNPLSVARMSGAPNLAVDGTFKVPGLRNVALSAPYFHNGGTLTLADVVDFYNRGGDFANAEQHPAIEPLGLDSDDKAALVAFLMALTDPRVAAQSAPFDHPQLFVPNGHLWSVQDSVLASDSQGRARDNWVEIPATGAGGGAPLASFPTPGMPGTPPQLR